MNTSLSRVDQNGHIVLFVCTCGDWIERAADWLVETDQPHVKNCYWLIRLLHVNTWVATSNQPIFFKWMLNDCEFQCVLGARRRCSVALLRERVCFENYVLASCSIFLYLRTPHRKSNANRLVLKQNFSSQSSWFCASSPPSILFHVSTAMNIKGSHPRQIYRIISYILLS